MGLEQLVQVQVCYRPRAIPHEIMSSSSHSQMNIDSDVYSSMLAAAFGRLRVSPEGEVQGSNSQSSTGIMMSDTFAVLSSPQATLPDPKYVPLPDDSGSEHDEGDKWPVQDEPEGEAAPYEVQGEVQDKGAEQEEENDNEFYNPPGDVQEEYDDYNVGDMRQRSTQLKEYDRQRFQRRRLNDGGDWREYRQDPRYSGRREYKEDDPSHDRHKSYQRWTHAEIVEKRRKDEEFAAELAEHHRHVLWRRCTICYRRSMKPSWVWNRTCAHCHIHVCCKHAMEQVTPVYTPDIITAEGDAERHIPIGSTHRFYCGENIRILCTDCTRQDQERIATADDRERVPYEQR
eukprot:1649973-Amphidinium_carterae.1